MSYFARIAARLAPSTAAPDTLASVASPAAAGPLAPSRQRVLQPAGPLGFDALELDRDPLGSALAPPAALVEGPAPAPARGGAMPASAHLPPASAFAAGVNRPPHTQRSRAAAQPAAALEAPVVLVPVALHSGASASRGAQASEVSAPEASSPAPSPSWLAAHATTPAASVAAPSMPTRPTSTAATGSFVPSPQVPSPGFPVAEPGLADLDTPAALLRALGRVDRWLRADEPAPTAAATHGAQAAAPRSEIESLAPAGLPAAPLASAAEPAVASARRPDAVPPTPALEPLRRAAIERSVPEVTSETAPSSPAAPVIEIGRIEVELVSPPAAVSRTAPALPSRRPQPPPVHSSFAARRAFGWRQR
jgi:hypothetical protein